jgi:UDP-N-acetylmuramoylalanine--D-glutamate ligase
MISNRDILDTDAIKTFAGMRVLVFGLGILGGGVAAANWLIRHGARVTVTDLKAEADLAGSLKKLAQPVKLKLGKHDDGDIHNCDLVLFNPDIPVRSPYVALARKLNKRVENEATLFYRLCRLPIIAVTGTRGKTTTCAWIEHFLAQRFDAVPAGNSPDNPFMHTLQVLEDIAADPVAHDRGKARVVVTELPSYHLEYFQEKDRSPDVAVVTNIFQDHLNRHMSMQEYVDTKANVFRYQSETQSLILNHGNPWTDNLQQKAGRQRQLLFSMSKPFPGAAGLFHENDYLYYRDRSDIDWERVLEIQGFVDRRGRHNLENLLAGALAARQAGVAWAEIQDGIETLPEIAFRQEVIFQNHRLQVVNDNAATSPDGCMAAIERFGGGNCILITGGTDRELDYAAWSVSVKKRIPLEHLVFLEGSATDKMLHELKDYVHAPNSLKSLDECFDAALRQTKGLAPAVILFSPGAKSFEKFDNEFARGRAFNRIVERGLKKLKH